jgi:hypothetical protein
MAKSNKVEFAVKLEATPGIAETLASGDVKVRVRADPTIAPDVSPIDLEELRAVSSRSAHLTGIKTIQHTVAYNLRAPASLTTDPAVKDLWKSALFAGSEAKTIAIGAITAGPFQAGEIITGGTSAATGMVLQRTLTGSSPLPFIPLTGTFVTTEVITGGTSGATATSSAGPADGGYAFRPADPNTDVTGHHVTARLNRDGFQWTARGSLSDLSWELRNNAQAIVTQNFFGGFASQGDLALFGLATYPEENNTVPRLSNAGIKFGAYAPVGIVTMTLAWPTNPAPVEDANSAAADGVRYFDFARQLPTLAVQVDQVAAADYDFFSKLRDGELIPAEATLGSALAAGNKWTFAMPAAQLRSIRPDITDPQRAKFTCEFGLTGKNNEELLIWQH